MTLAERIFNFLGFFSQAQLSEAVKLELDSRHDWLKETADAQRWEIPETIIYANQSDLYRLSPDLGTAMDILGDDVGLSKLNVYRMVGEDRRDIPNHELELLLQTPNPLDSGLEFMRDTVMSYKLNGNAIWWLNRRSEYERPSEIWPIPYEMVKPVPDRRMYLSHYEYYPGMGKEPLRMETWEIVHFKTYNPHNRFVGLSPIESLVMTIQGNLGMRNTKTQTFTTRHGSPPDIIAFKEYPQDEAWADVKRELVASARENKTMLLRGVGDGVTWLSRAMSSKDAEFVENLRSDMETIFNRMAPGLLAMLDKNATEANALAARATYSEKALWKTLVTFSQKITTGILPAYGRKLYAEYDDPRVVDRSLQLAEQETYERSHTLAEVRKEKYGDDPLGDERDNMLIFEIQNNTSIPEAPEASPQEEQPADNMTGQDTGDEEVSMKAVDDLKRWRTMALRGKRDKAQAFVSRNIPEYTLASIKAKLEKTTEKSDIAELFNKQIAHFEKKPAVSAEQLLEGIRLGVQALEKKN